MAQPSNGGGNGKANGDQSCDQRSRSGMMNYEIRCGRYQDVLAEVQEVDAVIVDPPYSSRTHDGQNDKFYDGKQRRALSYTHWTADDVREFVSFWAPRNRGWFVAFSDSDLCGDWREAFEAAGLTGFQPLPLVIPGMTVRMAGDGPSSWAVYLNVARPKSLCRWGTRPGAYWGGQGEREHIGGKPLWAMRKIVEHYTKQGDLVCDPCSGAGTTLLAALMERRHAIGAEVDANTHFTAEQRIKAEYTPTLLSTTKATRTCSKCRGTFRLEGFAVDRSSITGRQSWCRRCKAEWEHVPANAFARMKRVLEPNEPGSFSGRDGWTLEKYLKRWEEADGKCTLCGAGLREWQSSGHGLDRIDNDTPHIPANCRLVCWPCNKKKSNGSPLAADQEIAMWVAKYGRGRVPWHKIREEWDLKRIELPDVEQYRVKEEIVQIEMFGAAR